MALHSFTFLLLIGTTLTASGAWADRDYPVKVQTTVQQMIRKNATDHLRSLVEKLNQSATEPKSYEEILRKNGFGPKDLAALKAHSQGMKPPFPKAVWKDEAVLIQDGKNSVTLSADEFERGAMKVNGKEFQWKRTEPANENLRRYDALFLSGSNSASLSFPPLIESAHAEEKGEVLTIQVAGLRFYFAALGELQPMTELNTQVTALVESCENPGGTGDDLYTTALYSAAVKMLENTEATPLRNCADVKAYTKKIQSRLPAEHVVILPQDLCANIDRLAKCSNANKPTISGRKKKSLPTTPTEEWQSQPAASPDKTSGAH